MFGRKKKELKVVYRIVEVENLYFPQKIGYDNKWDTICWLESLGQYEEFGAPQLIYKEQYGYRIVSDAVEILVKYLLAMQIVVPNVILEWASAEEVKNYVHPL